MAIFHLHIKNISRGDKRSAVACAAYRAGETLPNEAEERLSAFGGRRDVWGSAILLPEGAPARFLDRATLWNEAEAAENRKDARLAKEIEFALPRELPTSLWEPVAREMASFFVVAGHVVDLAIHQDAAGTNPHVHLMLTTRKVSPAGFGLKLRAADDRAFVTQARERWAHIGSVALAACGAGVVIDARSNAARGLDKSAGRHRGPDQAERRAKRALARPEREKAMDDAMMDARRALLRDRAALDRFPLLQQRPDWPPADPARPGAMSPAERAEFKAFWKEVETRQVEVWRPAEPVIENPDHADMREGLAALEAKFVELMGRETPGAAARRDKAEWNEVGRRMTELRQDLAERRAKEAHDQREGAAFREKYPTLTWEEQSKQEAARDFYPLPGPDERPIAPAELDRAQAAMLADMEREADSVLHRDPDLAWVLKPEEGQERRGEASALRGDPDLEWVLGGERPREEPELENERERER